MLSGAGITALMAATVTPHRPSGPWRTTLPGVPESVQAARRFVRDMLDGCPRADDLAQAVTELGSNALLWSAAGEGGTFTVTVRTAPRWARVEVTDPGPAPSPGAESNGWGLGIVAALTDRHDTSHGPGPARTCWAEATWPGPAPASEDSRHAR
jgi:anti-sigma regulatory factor (Ser/Thr protein kinase)